MVKNAGIASDGAVRLSTEARARYHPFSGVSVVEAIVPNGKEVPAMPVYEYHCDKCQKEVTLTLTISEHDKGPIKCPTCGGKALRPLLSAFVSQTSKKS